MQNRHNKNILRRLLQYSIILYLCYLLIASFFAINTNVDFEAYCPFGGIQSLSSYLLNNTLACSMTGTQIFMGVILIICVILLGKLFCSFICPIGSISELLSKIGKHFNFNINIPQKADSGLRLLKYLLLFITFFFTLKSSELFCKKYDPFYALASGFSYEVVIIFSLVSIFFVVSSIFSKLYWCKYLCPLSALSNILKHYWIFIPIGAVFFFLYYKGVYIKYTYVLITICAIGAVIELFFTTRFNLSPFKIIRNHANCTSCNICNKICHQNISITSFKKVNHIDCNLCGDCLYSCPEQKALRLSVINYKWLPAILTVVLTIAGFIFANKWDIPTINEKWGTKTEMSNSQVLIINGLDNIKCYGSSKAFSAKMKKQNGIYGVATFVKERKVKITYNPDIISSDQIKKGIFTPIAESLKQLNDSINTIYEYSMGVEGLFDTKDNYNLKLILESNDNICGFISEYGCPVILNIYSQHIFNIEYIIKLIETNNNLPQYEKSNIRVVSYNEEPVMISQTDYFSKINLLHHQTFNNFSKYTHNVLKYYITPMPNNSNASNTNWFISHISQNKNIIEFRTTIDSLGYLYANITYIDTAINPTEIFKIINADNLTITYSNGVVKKIQNPFVFATKGNVEEYIHTNYIKY